MADIYAYITHKSGVADDSALELVAAAKKIDADAAVTAIVTGSGAEVDKVADEVAASYNRVLKFNLEALAYPNAEVVRKLLVNVLPADAILLVSNDTFGMDLGPGLSIKLDSTFVADVVGIEGVDGTALKVIRQEYSGMVSTHVTADISSGAVVNLRPGAFAPDESRSAGGSVEDRSGDAGDLTAKRTFLEVVEAEVGDQVRRAGFCGPRHRRRREYRSCPGTGRCHGRGGLLLAAHRGCQVAGEIPPGGHLRSDGQTQGVPGLRDQRQFSAHGRHQGRTVHRGHQQERQGADLPGRRRGHRGRHPRLFA